MTYLPQRALYRSETGMDLCVCDRTRCRSVDGDDNLTRRFDTGNTSPMFFYYFGNVLPWHFSPRLVPDHEDRRSVTPPVPVASSQAHPTFVCILHIVAFARAQCQTLPTILYVLRNISKRSLPLLSIIFFSFPFPFSQPPVAQATPSSPRTRRRPSNAARDDQMKTHAVLLNLPTFTPPLFLRPGD